MEFLKTTFLLLYFACLTTSQVSHVKKLVRFGVYYDATNDDISELIQQTLFEYLEGYGLTDKYVLDIKLYREDRVDMTAILEAESFSAIILASRRIPCDVFGPYAERIPFYYVTGSSVNCDETLTYNRFRYMMPADSALMLMFFRAVEQYAWDSAAVLYDKNDAVRFTFQDIQEARSRGLDVVAFEAQQSVESVREKLIQARRKGIRTYVLVSSYPRLIQIMSVARELHLSTENYHWFIPNVMLNPQVLHDFLSDGVLITFLHSPLITPLTLEIIKLHPELETDATGLYQRVVKSLVYIVTRVTIEACEAMGGDSKSSECLSSDSFHHQQVMFCGVNTTSLSLETSLFHTTLSGQMMTSPYRTTVSGHGDMMTTTTVSGHGHMVTPTTTTVSGHGHMMTTTTTTAGGHGHMMTTTTTTAGGHGHMVTPATTTVSGHGHMVTPATTTVSGHGHMMTITTTTAGGHGHMLTPATTTAGGHGHMVTPATTTVSGHGHMVTPATTTVSGHGHMTPATTVPSGHGHVAPVAGETEASSHGHGLDTDKSTTSCLIEPIEAADLTPPYSIASSMETASDSNTASSQGHGTSASSNAHGASSDPHGSSASSNAHGASSDAPASSNAHGASSDAPASSNTHGASSDAHGSSASSNAHGASSDAPASSDAHGASSDAHGNSHSAHSSKFEIAANFDTCTFASSFAKKTGSCNEQFVNSISVPDSNAVYSIEHVHGGTFHQLLAVGATNGLRYYSNVTYPRFAIENIVFSSRALVVGAVWNPPWLSWEIENGNPVPGTYKGYLYDVILELSKVMEWNFTMLNETATIFGPGYNMTEHELETKMNLLFESDTCDMFLYDKIIHGNRILLSDTVSITAPIQMSKMYLLTKRVEKNENVSIWQFLAPFKDDSWVALWSSLLLVSLVITYINKNNPYEFERAKHGLRPGAKHSEHLGFLNAVWFSFAPLVEQSTTLLPRSASLKILTGTWWFFVMLVIASYTANMISFMTQVDTQGITTPTQLARQQEISYGFLPDNPMLLNFLPKAKDHPYSAMWDQIKKNWDKSIPPDLDTALQWIIDGKFILISSFKRVVKALRDSCEYDKVGDGVYKYHAGLPVRKGFIYLPAMNDKISYLRDMGKLEEFQQKWFGDLESSCELQGQSASAGDGGQLDIKAFIGMYVFLTLGMAGTVLICLFETGRIKYGGFRGMVGQAKKYNFRKDNREFLKPQVAMEKEFEKWPGGWHVMKHKPFISEQEIYTVSGSSQNEYSFDQISGKKKASDMRCCPECGQEDKMTEGT